MHKLKRHSRVISSPHAQTVIFQTYWDYVAFALGIIFGSFAFGYAMKVYLFGL
jgi:hypothetical protein